jgi:hypothetical protein
MERQSRDAWNHPISPTAYLWTGIALLVVASWLPSASDGFSDPPFAAPLCGLLASIGIAALLIGAIAHGILLARAERRR